jgi:flagellar basal body-associated protein FliL
MSTSTIIIIIVVALILLLAIAAAMMMARKRKTEQNRVHAEQLRHKATSHETVITESQDVVREADRIDPDTDHRH